MPLSKQFLKLLACPDDKAAVTHILKGSKETLKCTKCKRVFEVKDGVPIMLPKNFVE